MEVKRYIGKIIAVFLAILLLVTLALYFNLKIDYSNLLRESIDYKQDKYELLKLIESINRDIYEVKSNLQKYDTLRKEILNRSTEIDKTSILHLVPREFNTFINHILDRYAKQSELLASKLFYISAKGAFRDIPSIWPASGWLTSVFGVRRHPIFKENRFHRGIDIANHPGTPIVATACGKIVYVGKKGGYGNTVEIEHNNGIRTQYSHLDKIYVKSGVRVEKGERIASMGNTGISTGPHIHYEVRQKNVSIDPIKFIFN